MGGFITSREEWGSEQSAETGENPRTLSLTLRIPSDQLDAFVEQAKQVGIVTASSISETDVTDQYTDTDRRLQAYQKQYDRVLEMMDQVTTVEELIQIESELSRLEMEIESCQGTLNYWDARVNYSTVYIYVDEVRRAISANPSLGERMRTALANSWDDFTQGCQDLVVNLYAAIPYIAVWIVVLAAAGGDRRPHRPQGAKGPQKVTPKRAKSSAPPSPKPGERAGRFAASHRAASMSSSLATRRRNSSEVEKRAARKRSISSSATVGPTICAPSAMICTSSCSTHWCAVYRSWQTEARMPRTLLQAMAAPTPVPQNMMPRSASPERMAGGHLFGDVGKVHGLFVVAAVVLDFVALAAKDVQELNLQRIAGVVGTDGEFHCALPP